MNIRMTTKGKRPLRSLTPSDKVHAIQRIHDGESKASVARDIGVPESTLRGWCKNEDKLRFMSRQSAAEKNSGETLASKLDSNVNPLIGPSEKRQRLDISLPLNFSNKIKFDELTTFKRVPLTGLDFGANKPLNGISTFNGLATDYVAFNSTTKNKAFGADISRSSDPCISAVSPLSQLPGLTGLSQSPLGISFNELTSNFNILAQLNPGLAAMSSLNTFASSENNLRASNFKPKSQINSPRSEAAERQTGLTVKNWAKQKPLTPSLPDSSLYGINLSQSDSDKSSNTTLMPPQLCPNMPPISTMSDDPILFWLKSQQAMVGLSNLYPPPAPVGAASSPIRSSTPQQLSLHASTPPIISSPLTPSSTPSASLDDKNSAWYNWCKAFGASLNPIAPATPAHNADSLQHSALSVNDIEPLANLVGQAVVKSGFENILYTQLTKDAATSPSVQSSSSIEQITCELSPNVDFLNKPEDLSAKKAKAKNPLFSIHPTLIHRLGRETEQTDSNKNTPAPSPIHIASERDLEDSELKNVKRNSLADCRDVLDNLLYKINKNADNNDKISLEISCAGSESEASYNSDHHNINDCSHNNKTDEEERAKSENDERDDDNWKAITHGEKFLQWLENNCNPRVTAVQLMQLRFLLSSVKAAVEHKSIVNESKSRSNISTSIEIYNSSEETKRSIRRRK